MKKIIAIILLLMISFTMAVYGEDGEGQGGGENKDQPLIVVSSSIANGQREVSLSPKIVLEFNKNVVNMTVSANNKNCFSMKSDNGENVNVSVEMGDDQVDPSAKRIITVVPQEALKPGVAYTLTVSGNLAAKNGTKTGSATNISFTTVGQKAEGVQAEMPNAKAKDSVAESPKNKVTELPKEVKIDKEVQNQVTTEAVGEEPQEQGGQTDKLAVTDEGSVENKIGVKIIFGGAILVGLGLLAVLAWRRVNGKK